MGKIHTRVHHKDQALDDHAHRLPDGSFTGGQILKPNKDRSFPHTHLYTGPNGDTMESCPAEVGGDHVHGTEKGVSGGPVPVRKDAFEAYEQKQKDLEQRDAAEMNARSMFKDVDESKWSKAKDISKESYGQVKWPFVQSMYQKLGGE
jgi:hypothetical protein